MAGREQAPSLLATTNNHGDLASSSETLARKALIEGIDDIG